MGTCKIVGWCDNKGCATGGCLAQKAVAAEREACAKIADEVSVGCDRSIDDEGSHGRMDAKECVRKIRARAALPAPTSVDERERQRKIEFDIMYNEFEAWEKTAEAFECAQTSDFKEVWVTAYRAGMKAQRIAQLKVDILLASDSAGGGS